MRQLSRLFKRVFRNKFSFTFIYSDSYWMVKTGNHAFPSRKYRLLYEKLLYMGARKENFLSPKTASIKDVCLVHSEKYVKKLLTGGLSPSEAAAIELPFSPELRSFAFLCVGGTVLAAEKALEDGISFHIGGGFHHAFPDHGEGFCVLNDVAVAIEKLRREGRIQKALVVDCDVHQGNGTAAIFLKTDDVFTFSIHQMDLYPAQKPASSLDVELWSGDGDEKYLASLRLHIPQLYSTFKPELIFYLAGADPYKNDQLGGLKLSIEGLKERDRIVLEEARRHKIPVVILLAGGYAYDIHDTVSIHLNTFKIAQKIHKKPFLR
ncbi:MAG: histone deacetylase [Candidatus Aminicenantes bacterium]|nr:histone deacetylase [Candidatus Aminicenantes bacterium]